MVQKGIQHSMTLGGRPLKKPILIGGALYAALLPCHLVIWNTSIFLALTVSTLTLTTPPGSSVINVTPLFICNVQPGSLKVSSEIKDFCAHSSSADNFKCVGVFLYRLISLQ